MRRLPLPLIVVILLLGLLAESAAGAAPEQRIESAGLTFAPGELSTLIIDCPQGYKAVAAAIVRREAGISILWGFEDSSGAQSKWIFRVLNRGQNAAFVRGEVRCVKVFEPPPFDHPWAADLTGIERLDPGEVARPVAICPRGDAPLGWGFRESAPGGGLNDPPEPGAANRLFEVRPSGRRLIFGVEGVGVFPSEVQFQAICIDKHQQNRRVEVNFRVSAEEFVFGVGAGHGRAVDLRCGRGTTPAGVGWELPAQSRTFAEPFDLRPTFTRTGFFNGGDARQRLGARPFCMRQRMQRR